MAQHLSQELSQELDYLRAHYDSWRGWIGRNSYWLIPAIVLVSYELGKYIHMYHHCK